MAEHRTHLTWSRDGGPFVRGNYAQEHAVRFMGGQTVTSSAAPDFGGDPGHADPEQLLIAALSSCHMLTFLAVAANRGYVPDSYVDDADGELGKNAESQTQMTHVTLRPRVSFSGEKRPTAEEYEQLHARAHKGCFIANSVKTAVEVKPTLA